jgi:hypothetical protein
LTGAAYDIAKKRAKMIKVRSFIKNKLIINLHLQLVAAKIIKIEFYKNSKD